MKGCVDVKVREACFLNDASPPSVPPSPELVERVRDLYHKRVPDVRFLIPVINGLEKVSFHPNERVPLGMVSTATMTVFDGERGRVCV